LGITASTAFNGEGDLSGKGVRIGLRLGLALRLGVQAFAETARDHVDYLGGKA
jgi:hypothetical protein